MSRRTVSMLSSAHRPRTLRRDGFSLVELMVTVTIISLLVAAAVPAVIKVKQRSLATAIGNDFRVFATAFDTYSHETGSWPAEVDAGAFPPEMANRIQTNVWQRITPMGGQYNWDNNQTHQGTKFRAAIAITSTSASAVTEDLDLMEMIDRVIDDGNLTTGSFRIGADNEPVFIIAP